MNGCYSSSSDCDGTLLLSYGAAEPVLSSGRGACDRRGCGFHRYLHSFPTRRSSDLNGSAFPNLRFGGITASGEMSSRSDRKSTRLNSSHRCISYAVFCLKKKKQRFHCFLGPRLKNSILERPHVSRHRIFARQNKRAV